MVNESCLGEALSQLEARSARLSQDEDEAPHRGYRNPENKWQVGGGLKIRDV
jgi:hypothetical protein